MIDLNKRELVSRVKKNYIDWGLDSINAPKVWSKTKGEGVKILLIDTGIHSEHKDLNESFKSGYNFFERSHDVEDKEGHGTHMAGLITGKLTGVAPNSELHVVKVLNDDARGSYASVMDGVTYAMNYGFDVVSMSLGIEWELPIIMRERIKQAYNKGIVMVSATGNQGVSVAYNPAKMDEVIAVGGLDKDMNKVSFSNDGHNVLAPSVDILSTYNDGKYARMSGTSCANSLVAGGIALLISYYRKQGIDIKAKDVIEIVNNGGEIFDLKTLIKEG